MIYIITPYLADFRHICKENGWDAMISGAGSPRNPNIIWIYNWQQLLGRRIFKIDMIIWGEQAHLFPTKDYERLQFEIEFRKLTTNEV